MKTVFDEVVKCIAMIYHKFKICSDDHTAKIIYIHTQFTFLLMFSQKNSLTASIPMYAKIRSLVA